MHKKTPKLVEFMTVENQTAQEIARHHEEVIEAIDELMTLICEFLLTAQAPNWLFAPYFNGFRSYIPLATASVLRCHFAQAALCLRYAFDAAAKATYCLAHAEAEQHAVKKDTHLEDPDLGDRCYEWIGTLNSRHAKSLKDFKGKVINRFFAHASINAAMGSVEEAADGRAYSAFDKAMAPRIDVMLFEICKSAMRLLCIVIECGGYPEDKLPGDFRARFARINCPLEEVRKTRIKPFADQLDNAEDI